MITNGQQIGLAIRRRRVRGRWRRRRAAVTGQWKDAFALMRRRTDRGRSTRWLFVVVHAMVVRSELVARVGHWTV